MEPADFWDRARQRCAQHLSGRAVCSDCLLVEMEQVLLEENPQMKAGDVYELVHEWVWTGRQPVLH